jgi:catalase
MTDSARSNLHANTAKILSHVNYPIIAQRYLAQVYNIDPAYSRAVYDAAKFKFERFDFKEVEEMAPEAPTWYKAPVLRPSQGNRMVGFAPEKPFYNM